MCGDSLGSESKLIINSPIAHNWWTYSLAWGCIYTICHTESNGTFVLRNHFILDVVIHHELILLWDVTLLCPFINCVLFLSCSFNAHKQDSQTKNRLPCCLASWQLRRCADLWKKIRGPHGAVLTTHRILWSLQMSCRASFSFRPCSSFIPPYVLENPAHRGNK